MTLPDESCKTPSDARIRVLCARMGSLAPDATMDYLLELANCVLEWQNNIAHEINRKACALHDEEERYARKMQSLSI